MRSIEYTFVIPGCIEVNDPEEGCNGAKVHTVEGGASYDIESKASVNYKPCFKAIKLLNNNLPGECETHC